MAFAVGALDEAVREYLLYRGFTQTLKFFEAERRDDRDKGFSFKVNRIVDYIMQCVFKSDFASLQSFWSYLYGRFFSQMNSESLTMAYRLETNVLRLFLVQASKTGRQEEVRTFFEKMSDSLHDRKEWKDWFALPFTKSPEQHPTFRLYYSKEWLDTFQITLHNFFSTLFTSIPLPALLSFEAEHQKMQALSTENHHLHNQLAETRRAFAELEMANQKLEARLAQNAATQASNAAAISGKRRYSGGKADKSQGKAAAAAVAATARKKAVSTPAYVAVSSPTGKKQNQAVKETVAALEKTEKMTSVTAGGGSQPPANTFNKETELPTVPAALPLFQRSEGPGTSKTTGDPQRQAAAGVQVDGSVTPHADADGSCPFLPVSQVSYREHSAPITHCKFSPNATQVASVDTDGRMRVWDPNKCSTNATTELTSSLLSFDWVPQLENLVLLGTGGGLVKLFDTTGSRYLWEVATDVHYPRILSVACGPSTFAVSASDTAVPSLTSSQRTLTLTSPSLPSHRAATELTAMEAKGASAGGVATERRGDLPIPGGVYIWDLKSLKMKCSLPLSPLPVAVNCMCFNHNSNLLLTGAVDGMIRLFDVFQQECLCAWRAHSGEVYNVQFSSDETSVYSMGSDDSFCQWSINQSGAKVAQFAVDKSACNPARGWSQLPGRHYHPTTPRGNLFAFESEDSFVLTCARNQATIYAVGQESEVTTVVTITGHSGPVTCVDWLHGRSFSTCLTGSTDCSVNVINLLKN